MVTPIDGRSTHAWSVNFFFRKKPTPSTTSALRHIFAAWHISTWTTWIQNSRNISCAIF
jgi:hypothetical protein